MNVQQLKMLKKQFFNYEKVYIDTLEHGFQYQQHTGGFSWGCKQDP